MGTVRISDRVSFGKYCLRKAGDGVLQINISEEQVEDRIDDALDKFWEFHGEGNSLVPLKYQLTQDDIDSSTIKVPEGVISVNRILNPSTGSASAMALNNIQYQEFLIDALDIRSMGKSGLSNYVQTISYLGTLSQVLGNNEKAVEFNQYRGKAEIIGGFKNLKVGDWVILECWTIQDPEQWAATWNNQWLKAYCSALILKQWAMNLMKYGNAQLPGGMQINAEAVMAEAKEEIQKLEQELELVWQEPPMFFMA